MFRMARQVLVIVVLACSTIVAAQTEPEVLTEYRAELDRSLARDDFESAMTVMRKMILLRLVGVRFSAEFYWQYARVGLAVRDHDVARAGLERYLDLAGPAGEHAGEARRLLASIRPGE